MTISSGKKLSFKDWTIIGCLFFSAIASLLADEVNQIALYVVLPLAFVLSFSKNKSLRVNKYTNWLFLLFGWIIISSIWAENSTYASAEINRVLGSFIVCYVVASNVKNEKMIPWLYLTYIVLYVGAWNYASSHLIIDISGIDNDGYRLNDDKLNANTMAYYTFYSTFILFILGEIILRIQIKRIVNIAFLCMVPLSFFVALTTASRQVLIIQIPLISLLLYTRYIKNKAKSKKILFVGVILAIIIFLIPKAEAIYDNSFLAVRAQTSFEDDSRSMLMKDAFNVGMQNLPFGVGAGNYIVYSFNKHFSHMTYLELFANEGPIGAFIYVYILFLFIRRQYRRYKFFSDKFFLLFLIFGLIYALDNFFYVFHSDIWLISFFVLVASHSEFYYHKKRQSLHTSLAN